MSAATYRCCQGIIVGFYLVNVIAPWLPMPAATVPLFPWSGLLVFVIHAVQLGMYTKLRRSYGATVPPAEVGGILLYGMLHVRAQVHRPPLP
ncbi:MAG: hypothetical protein AAF799_02235 [Myxococcota bacterium]